MATVDEALAALDQASRNNFNKSATSSNPALIGAYYSWWRIPGQPPDGAVPGVVAGLVPDKDTNGALKFPDPAAGEALHLLKVGGAFAGVEIGPLTLYDRLLHTSGLVGNVTTAQTVNTVALTRGGPNNFINGEDVELFAEVYSPIGANQPNLTVNYTDPAGVARTSVTPVPVANNLNVGFRMMRILTHDGGHKGFKSVQSVQWASTVGSAGNWGLTFVRRVAEIPVGLISSVGMDKNMFELGMPKVDTDACLAFLCAPDNGTTANIFGDIYIGDL